MAPFCERCKWELGSPAVFVLWILLSLFEAENGRENAVVDVLSLAPR